MAAKELFPRHLREYYGGTSRDYKQTKREEADEALAALREFRMYSAWLPREAYNDMLRAINALESMREKLSLENWGR